MQKKLRVNNLSTILYQVTAICVGFIIPRLILGQYGSGVNGLAYSIAQMLSVITYLDLGISAVAQAALYKPIKQGDEERVSIIYSAIKKYFRILTVVLVIYIGILCYYYGYIRNDGFTRPYTITLVLAIAISSIGQYLWGISNQVLLAADQKIYIYTIWNIITSIANAVATYILIELGQPIQLVKLIASLIFLSKPIALQLYVNKNYKIKIDKKVLVNILPNQWSGLVQHIATTLTASLDTIVLTLVSTMSNVSIYNIYALPLNGVRVLIESIGGGYKSFFGGMLVDTDISIVRREFEKYEVIIHALATIFACCAYKLLVPFVMIYTRGVKDVDYSNYTFAVLMVMAYFIMIIRIPYTTIVASAGHFRQTQKICLIEVFVNVVISFATVYKIGLIGVAVGTCMAVMYKMLAFVIYLKKNILFRNIKKFLQIICLDLISFVLFFIITLNINVEGSSYFQWFIQMIILVFVAFGITFGVFFIFNHKVVIKLLKKEKE